MTDSPFPTAKALMLAAILAAVHGALALFLLVLAMSAAFFPAMIAFWLLALPLIIVVPDLISRPHQVAWWLNSLAYGLSIAWIWCSMRWARHQRNVAWWRFRIGTPFVAFALVMLLLGELYHPVTGPDDARVEAGAIARAEAADASVEIMRQRVGYYERVAADETKTAYVRELHARNAEEEALKVKKEQTRARSQRAEGAYYARLKIRPGTRYPALMLLACGVCIELAAFRQRRRSKIAPKRTEGEEEKGT